MSLERFPEVSVHSHSFLKVWAYNDLEYQYTCSPCGNTERQREGKGREWREAERETETHGGRKRHRENE